jgi:chaperone modulatory protein CbpM
MMLPNQAEVFWLDAAQIVSLEDLVALSGLNETQIGVLVELGALQPKTEGTVARSFSADCVVIARTAKRLQADFELDDHALALVLDLLKRIKILEADLGRLRALQPHQG